MGALIYQEPLATDKFIGFGFVWVALIIFGVEGYLANRGQVAVAA